MSIAQESGADMRIAAARTEAARQSARSASSTLYPSVSLESGVFRSNDPVAVFGTKLRQGVFGEPDFSLPALNNPDPVTDWTAGVRVAWAGLDPAVWAAADAAGREAEAVRIDGTRAREAVRLATANAYYLALRADARVRAANAAIEAAEAVHARFERRLEEGLLTEADLLQAGAELASAEAEGIAARQQQHDARRALGLVLGWPLETIPVPAEAMNPPSAGPVAEFAPVDERADLRALDARLAAAEARTRSASRTWLPRLEAFGGFTSHGRVAFTSDASDWTVGVGLRWDAFTGMRRTAEIGRARAEATALRARQDEARRAASVEVQNARGGLETARRAYAANRSAAEAATAARDLMRRRFDEGLAMPSDLLDAEARLVDMEGRAIDALTRFHLAVERLRFALGDPGNDSNSDDLYGGAE